MIKVVWGLYFTVCNTQAIEKEVANMINEDIAFCEISPPPDVVETFHHVYKDAPSFLVRGCDPLSFHPHQ